jgi:hypothetical protein
MLSRTLFAVSACICVPAGAGTIVVPPGNATVEGNGSSPNFLGADAITLQTVIGASLLTGLNVGDSIDGIQFRLDGGLPTGPAVNTVWSDWSLTLSPSNNAAGSLSATFAANIAAGAVTVRSGPLTLLANSLPGGATPNAFGLLIAFTTPYTYTGGNLLLTLTHTVASNSPGAAVDYQFLANAENQGAAGYRATTATLFQQNAMPVIELTTVPEPASRAMFSFGLAGVAALAWRRRKAKAAA